MQTLERYGRALDSLGLAARDVRVLARAAIRTTHGPEAPPRELVDAVATLAEAVRTLERELEDPGRDGAAAGERCLHAAFRAGEVLDERHDVATSAVVAQVRATAVDLLVGSGLEPGEAHAALEERESTPQPSG